MYAMRLVRICWGGHGGEVGVGSNTTGSRGWVSVCGEKQLQLLNANLRRRSMDGGDVVLVADGMALRVTGASV